MEREPQPSNEREPLTAEQLAELFPELDSEVTAEVVEVEQSDGLDAALSLLFTAAVEVGADEESIAERLAEL